MTALRLFLPGYHPPDWFPVFARLFARDILATRYDVEYAEPVGASPYTNDPLYNLGGRRVTMHPYALAIERLDTGAISVITTLDDPLNLFTHWDFDPRRVSRVLTGQYLPDRLRRGMESDERLRGVWPSVAASPLRPWLYRPRYWMPERTVARARARRRGLYFRGVLWHSRTALPILQRLAEPRDHVEIDAYPIDAKREIEAETYMRELGEYRVALSVAGVGDICNRDIECFAMGVPVLRPTLRAQLAVPLLANEHYIDVPYETLGAGHHYPDHPADPEALARDILATYRRVRDDLPLLERIAANARAYYERNLAFPAIGERSLELLDLGPTRRQPVVTGQLDHEDYLERFLEETGTAPAAVPAPIEASPPTAPPQTPRQTDRANLGPSAELSLVTVLSRPLRDEAALERARRLAGTVRNWERVVDLARFHGVVAQVAENCERLGAAVDSPTRSTLHLDRVRFTATELLKLGRWRKLCAAFAGAGIRAVTLKGYHVTFAVYGSLGRRLVGDFDILIHPRDLPASIALLREHGYVLSERWARAIEHIGLARAVAHGTEMSLSSQDGLVVDLHWVAGPRGSVLPTEELLAAALPIPQVDVPALGNSLGDTLAMLVTHGHRSAWGRLRWLVDVAEVLQRLTPADAETAQSHLRRVGAMQQLANAVALVEMLWGLVPEAAGAFGRLGAPDRGFVAAVAERHERGWDAVWLRDRRRPLRLLRDRVAIGGLTPRTLLSAARPTHLDWATLRLPALLHPLYFVVRPIRVLLEAARRNGAGRPSPVRAGANQRERP